MPPRARVTHQEKRLATYLTLCTLYTIEEVLQQLQQSDKQQPFYQKTGQPVNRTYNRQFVEKLRYSVNNEATLNLYARERARLGGNGATQIGAADRRGIQEFCLKKDNIDLLGRDLAVKVKEKVNLPAALTVGAIENLLSAFYLAGDLKHADQQTYPTTWKRSWIDHLVTTWLTNWKEDTENVVKWVAVGGEDAADGEVTNYLPLVAEMNSAFKDEIPRPFTDQEVKHGFHQAIKSGWIRCPAADQFILDDGEQLVVNELQMRPMTGAVEPDADVLPPIYALG